MKTYATRVIARHLTGACLLLALTACVSEPFRLESLYGMGSLDHWVEWKLIPHLKSSLAEHPRLRNQPVTVVHMEEGVIQPRIDGLTRDLRRRITDALVRTPGVQVARLPGSEARHHRRLTGANCGDPLDTGYFIGIESVSLPGDRWRIAVRILDAREGAWVSGFGLDWKGRLNAEQRTSQVHSSEDELLRGLRVLPFRADQSDLAAGYFANNLSCLLRQRGLSESRIHLAPASKSPARLVTLVGLVDNYLSRLHQVQVVDRAKAADYLLESEIHPIDDGLYQLWFRLRERDSAGQVPGLDTAAYVQLAMSQQPKPSRTRSAAPRSTAKKKPALRASVSELGLLHPRYPSQCRGGSLAQMRLEPVKEQMTLSPYDCFQVQARGHGRLFLMFHKPQGGLVRIDKKHCTNQPLNLVNGTGVGTLYALAVTDTRQAADIQRLWGRLNDACDQRPGTGPDPESWSIALERLIARKPQMTAWSAVRYRFHTQE